MPLNKDRIIIPLGVGLNTEVSDKLIAPGSVLTLENAYSDRSGRIVKRTGYRVVSRPEPETTPTPQLDGLVLWTKGDFELVDDGGGKMLTQGNAADPTFNPGLREKGGIGGQGPEIGLDTLDGIPGTTWSTDLAGDVIAVNLEPADGSGAVHLKDRNGTDFGYDTGETQTITWLAVVIPRLAPDNGGSLGGTIFRLGNTSGGGQLDLEFIFRLFVPDLPPVGAESLTLMSNDWTDDYASALYGPSTPADTYEDIPLLLHFESGSRSDNQVYVSGPGIGTMVPLTLTPGTLPSTSTHTHQQSTYGTVDIIASLFDRWVGARFEDIVYDFKLADSPANLTQVYAYIAQRFPTLGLDPV
jgi:hypothetical protein